MAETQQMWWRHTEPQKDSHTETRAQQPAKSHCWDLPTSTMCYIVTQVPMGVSKCWFFCYKQHSRREPPPTHVLSPLTDTFMVSLGKKGEQSQNPPCPPPRFKMRVQWGRAPHQILSQAQPPHHSLWPPGEEHSPQETLSSLL